MYEHLCSVEHAKKTMAARMRRSHQNLLKPDLEAIEKKGDITSLRWNDSDLDDDVDDYGGDSDEEGPEFHTTTTQVSTFLTPGYIKARKRADFEEVYSEGNFRDGSALERRAEKLFGIGIRFVDPVTLTPEEDKVHRTRVYIWMWMKRSLGCQGGVFTRYYKRVIEFDCYALWQLISNACALPSMMTSMSKLRAFANHHKPKGMTFDEYAQKLLSSRIFSSPAPLLVPVFG